MLPRCRQLTSSSTNRLVLVKGLLAWNEWLNGTQQRPQYRFFVTDEPGHFARLGQQFLGQPIRSVERVSTR